MKTIAIMNIKGGVGKTTSVTTIGHILAKEFKKKVLLVDLDAQANTTALFSEVDYYERLANKFSGEIMELDKSISTLFLDKDVDVHECIRNTGYENLDIIESDLRLTEIENLLKADVTSPQQFKLKRHLEKVDAEYDYCIMDCSPSVGIININGLAMADEVYIPTRSDGYSLEGVAYAKSLIGTVADYNSKLSIGGVFFTAWEPYNCPKGAYKILETLVGDKLLPFNINKSVKLTENTMMQMPLLAADDGKNKSKATLAYIDLAGYIDAEDREKYLNDYKERKLKNGEEI